MTDLCRLPLAFDVARLQSDLGKIEASEWQRHFNSRDYEGTWSVVALRSSSGRTEDIFSHPNTVSSLPTPLLARMDYMGEVLDQIETEILIARLLLLGAGSRIKEHQDPMMAIVDGTVRLHIPIQTDCGVSFFLEERQVRMAPGECWFLNFSKKHRVDHTGNLDRVHLVVDIRVNDWFMKMVAMSECAV